IWTATSTSARNRRRNTGLSTPCWTTGPESRRSTAMAASPTSPLAPARRAVAPAPPKPDRIAEHFRHIADHADDRNQQNRLRDIARPGEPRPAQHERQAAVRLLQI